MLAIRMQRTGRKGHAMFRVVVQEAHRTPSSGKVVAQLGSYDPHTKTATIAKDKATFYLTHGAQPSDRAAALLEKEGVSLPKWYKKPTVKTGAIRNAEKLRRNQPAPVAAADEAPVETAVDSPEEADTTEA